MPGLAFPGFYRGAAITMLKIEIHPSRHLAILLGIAHTAAAGISLVVDMPTPARLLLMLGIAASFVHALYGPALLRAGGSIIAVELGEGGKLSVRTRRGGWHAATLRDSSFVASYLAVLNLKLEKAYFAHHVVIMPDSMDAEDFRRLRVWLRWRKAAAV